MSLLDALVDQIRQTEELLRNLEAEMAAADRKDASEVDRLTRRHTALQLDLADLEDRYWAEAQPEEEE